VSDTQSDADVIDLHPAPDEVLSEILAGLDEKPQKTLPCKYLYDERGCDLFDAITECEDYYPTRTEAKIFEQRADEIAAEIGPRRMVIEPGAGNGEKGVRLLRILNDPVAFVPIEIARSYVDQSVEAVNKAMPDVEVLPVCGDFAEEIQPPAPTRAAEGNLVFLPGSTIGNFDRDGRRRIFEAIARLAGPGGEALLGVDLVKDIDTLLRAYDDSEGVTASFDMNLLERINRETGADFDLDAFHHEARWNPIHSRIEMHLVSDRDQVVTIDGRRIHFADGETIHTESSHKFTVEGFAAEAEHAGLRLRKAWLDERGWFSLLLFDRV
jgi:dimethylhistidine N-methyltransferase